MDYKPELILVPHHELSYSEEERRDVNSFTIDEIRKFDKAAAVFYARATGLQETGMSPNEIGLMFDLLEKKKRCNIVELGRNFGCSTRIFVQHVVRHGGSFQSWDLKHWGNLEETWANQGFEVTRILKEGRHIENGHDYSLRIPGAEERTALIRIADSVKTHIEDESRWVDFLLIDTEHGLENALGEYMRWRQYLNSGAIIAFHDSTLPQVARAIELAKEVEVSTCGERIIREWHNERVEGFGLAALEWKG